MLTLILFISYFDLQINLFINVDSMDTVYFCISAVPHDQLLIISFLFVNQSVSIFILLKSPTVSWENWSQQWKPTLLAKEGIHLENLLNGTTAN